jgi:predicted TIM-barrel fold metal-dependent hydrolase
MSNISIKNVTMSTNFQWHYYDNHLHAFGNPKAVIEDLERRYSKHEGLERDEEGRLVFYGDFSMGRLVDDMAKLNCIGGIVKNIADIDPENPKNGRSIINANNWAIATSRKYAKFFVFGAIHPRFGEFADYSAEEEIKRLAENKIRGLSFDSCWQKFRPEAQEMVPIYREMANYGLVALFHVGYDSGGKYKSNLTFAQHLLAIHQAVPDLRIIACHLAAPRLGASWEDVLDVENIYLDIAYVPQYIKLYERYPSEPKLPKITLDLFLEIINRCPKRVLFSTDYPWVNPSVAIDFIWGLSISEQIKLKILRDNFQDLFALKT